MQINGTRNVQGKKYCNRIHRSKVKDKMGSTNGVHYDQNSLKK